MKKKALVLGGTRGMGKAIADALSTLGLETIAASKKDIDTSNLESVKRFALKEKAADILVLNTGGPPAKGFFDITEAEWLTYHNQLFLGFCVLLQNLQVRKNGYIFLLSTHHLREPSAKLVLSSAYRLAFSSVLKILSKSYAAENISCINIAPGPVETERLRDLKGAGLDAFTKSLPLGRAGKPKEIADFISSIVEHDIKYLNGVIINFDGGLSNCLF